MWSLFLCKMKMKLSTKFANAISLIIPVFNETENIEILLLRLNTTLRKAKFQYELIFIDDHSTDGTFEKLKELAMTIPPIRLYRKQGRQGKAYSLLQGFKLAKYPIVGMIDADLSYPPEAIPQMFQKLENCDIVIANRNYLHDVSKIRKILGKTFQSIFGKTLFRLNYDVQSGLKIFKREIIERISLNPTKWTFDLEFLFKAFNAGYNIEAFDIEFGPRKQGTKKLKLIPAALEMASMAVKLKLSPIMPAIIPPENGQNMKGSGFVYKRQKFITHTDISEQESALKNLSAMQIIVFAFLFIILTIFFLYGWHKTLVFLIGSITLLYFFDLIFNLFLIIRSFQKPKEITFTKNELKEKRNWPIYTIFCPLYKETEVIAQFAKAIQDLNYPKDKLDVLLLLEESDKETIQVAKDLNLPEYFRLIIVPHSLPKTKPKACNYGLAYAKGQYAVIYDAEDIPDPLQLKKAILTFEKTQNENVVCAQAKLNFYNPHQNLLTRLFTAEYSLWFNLVLTGLQSIGAPIPLGGTSNHFRVKDLNELKGWDPFNVTEDCDLGMRLCKRGYSTAIFDSTTMEEANSNFKNWFHQRSRWIKGYMQTYLVHMRRPQEFLSDWKKPHVITFQLVVGGKVVSMFINPLMWLTTISYFLLRPLVGSFIESLYPPTIFYMAIISLVFGNFLYMYYYMVGCAKKEQWELIKYAFLTPIYWLMMSVAAVMALVQLVTNPHYWPKTTHGLHLKKDPKTGQAILVPATANGD